MQIFVINLPSAIERRQLQQDQLTKLGLEYEILDATSVEDIDETTYTKHYFDWQRPLRKTEIACYYSHRAAWNKIIKSERPALILEDDAILSKYVPKLLDNLNKTENTDFITLENRSRKKFVARSYIDIDCNSKLIRLYQDRTGAAGYILWPTGAQKLIQLEKNSGIGLADAHITACHTLKAYQVEPSPIIQLDQCERYGISNPQTKVISESSVSCAKNSKGGWVFWIKRIRFQLALGLRQLLIITKSQRRYIKIRAADFSSYL